MFFKDSIVRLIYDKIILNSKKLETKLLHTVKNYRKEQESKKNIRTNIPNSELVHGVSTHFNTTTGE